MIKCGWIYILCEWTSKVISDQANAMNFSKTVIFWLVKKMGGLLEWLNHFMLKIWGNSLFEGKTGVVVGIDKKKVNS